MKIGGRWQFVDPCSKCWWDTAGLFRLLFLIVFLEDIGYHVRVTMFCPSQFLLVSSILWPLVPSLCCLTNWRPVISYPPLKIAKIGSFQSCSLFIFLIYCPLYFSSQFKKPGSLKYHSLKPSKAPKMLAEDTAPLNTVLMKWVFNSNLGSWWALRILLR